MFVRLRVLLAASLILAAFGGLLGAQVYRHRVPVQPPIVLSGSDVGVQITAREGTSPVGHLVVRVDGQWVPFLFESGTARLSTESR